MDCKSCGIEIPPVWVVALKSNICPSCGGEIMSSELQELITGLTEAMGKMPENPQGIACWLVSNYKLSKVNSYEPPEFKQQKKAVKPIQQNQLPKDTSSTEDFFLRANVDLAKLKNKKAPSPIKEIDDEDFPNEPIGDMDEVDKMMVVSSNSPISEDEKENIASMVENAKYGIEGSPYFQQIVEKQQALQNSIASGEGAVSRSGKPAGFRRC